MVSFGKSSLGLSSKEDVIQVEGVQGCGIRETGSDSGISVLGDKNWH